MFVCTSAESAPRASLKVPVYRVLRRVFAISTATLVLIGASGCEKPKAIDLKQNALLVGRVIDPTRSPVISAVIYENPAQTATSDPEGAFSLAAPGGDALVHIQAVGYQPQALHLRLIAGKTQLATPDGYIHLVPVQK